MKSPFPGDDEDDERAVEDLLHAAFDTAARALLCLVDAIEDKGHVFVLSDPWDKSLGAILHYLIHFENQAFEQVVPEYILPEDFEDETIF